MQSGILNIDGYKVKILIKSWKALKILCVLKMSNI